MQAHACSHAHLSLIHARTHAPHTRTPVSRTHACLSHTHVPAEGPASSSTPRLLHTCSSAPLRCACVCVPSPVPLTHGTLCGPHQSRLPCTIMRPGHTQHAPTDPAHLVPHLIRHIVHELHHPRISRGSEDLSHEAHTPARGRHHCVCGKRA